VSLGPAAAPSIDSCGGGRAGRRARCAAAASHRARASARASPPAAPQVCVRRGGPQRAPRGRAAQRGAHHVRRHPGDAGGGQGEVGDEQRGEGGPGGLGSQLFGEALLGAERRRTAPRRAVGGNTTWLRPNACSPDSLPLTIPPAGRRGARGQGQGQRGVQGRQARPRGAAVPAGSGDRGGGRVRRRRQGGARGARGGGCCGVWRALASGSEGAHPSPSCEYVAGPRLTRPARHPSPVTRHPSGTDQIKELRRSAWLNLAAVELKQHNWKEARKHASKVLETDPTNVKALYRRAQALVGLQVGAGPAGRSTARRCILMRAGMPHIGPPPWQQASQTPTSPNPQPPRSCWRQSATSRRRSTPSPTAPTCRPCRSASSEEPGLEGGRWGVARPHRVAGRPTPLLRCAAGSPLNPLSSPLVFLNPCPPPPNNRPPGSS
jgi:hypothetical protein